MGGSRERAGPGGKEQVEGIAYSRPAQVSKSKTHMGDQSSSVQLGQRLGFISRAIESIGRVSAGQSLAEIGLYEG